MDKNSQFKKLENAKQTESQSCLCVDYHWSDNVGLIKA
jgi:hypothetical protein